MKDSMMWTVLIAIVVVAYIILHAISRATHILGTALDELTNKVDAIQGKLDEIEDGQDGKRYVNPIEL